MTRTHTEVLLDLIDRWLKGDVSNKVLIRDLSGMAMNTDNLETENTALLAVVEDLDQFKAWIGDGTTRYEPDDEEAKLRWIEIVRKLAALPEHLK